MQFQDFTEVPDDVALLLCSLCDELCELGDIVELMVCCDNADIAAHAAVRLNA